MQSKLDFRPTDTVAMSQIELEKMLNVMLLRKSIGYSQFELSFLMGQRDYYVRDVEDPTHRLSYSVPFTNIFRQIFDCDVRAIVPDINQKPAYSIRLSEAIDDAGKLIYKAERMFEEGHVEYIATFGTEERKLLLKSHSTIPESHVKDWVISKFNSDYFNGGITALEIFKYCQQQLQGTVRPLFLANALLNFTKLKKAPRLIKKKDGNGRFVFEKHF